MDRLIKAGSTDVSVHLYIIDSTNGTPETGVVWNTAGIDLKYRREGAVVVAITEADLGTPALDDAHADGGFLEVGNGVYRLDLPDAACAAGAKHVTVFGTVTGMIVLPVEIQLTTFDLDTASSAQTGDSFARIGAAGASLSDLGGMSAGMKGEVNAEVDTALDTAIPGFPTADSINERIVMLDTYYTAARGAYLDELAAANLPTDVAAVKTDTAAILADTGTDGVVLANNAITAAKIATDAIGAAEVSAAAANKIADHKIRRSFENACDSSDGDTKSFRSELGAMAKLVNKVAISGGVLTAYEDDDATALGSQTITTDTNADPIVGADTD